MRLVLASLVIFSHAWPLGGFGPTPVDLGYWAVNAFFGISGYLIAGSRMRLSIREYFAHRVLRIFPAYWLVLAVTAFVLAPIASSLAGWNYQFQSAIGYLGQNAGLYIIQPGIHDTLMDAPWPQTWNVSIWTLFYEFAAYIAAAVLLTFACVRKRPIIILAVTYLLLICMMSIGRLPIPFLSALEYDSTLRFGSYFVVGMLIYFLSSRLRVTYLVGSIAAGVFAVMCVVGAEERLGQIPLTLFVLWLGAKLPLRIGSTNDISYGMYIWASPVQQLLAVSVGPALGPLLAGFLAFAITLPLAWLSWKMIERPAMSLRRRIPSSWLGRQSERAGLKASASS